MELISIQKKTFFRGQDKNKGRPFDSLIKRVLACAISLLTLIIKAGNDFERSMRPTVQAVT